MSREQVIVGRIGKPHGVAGDVMVQVRTDEPERRFFQGATLIATQEGEQPIEVSIMHCRWHSGRLLVRFDGYDRSTVEDIRGRLLEVVVDSHEEPLGEDEFYDRHLIGLTAQLSTGNAEPESVGVITDVLHLPGNDVLEVTAEDGRVHLVPFVNAIVPVVDVRGGFVTIDPPIGLLEDLTEAGDE